MNDHSEDPSYFLFRAKQEERQAEAATQAEAARAHRELAIRYSIKALLAHGDDER